MLGLIYLHIPQGKPPASMVQSYAEGIRASAPNHSIDTVAKIEQWSGGVHATYGPSILTADRLVLYYGDADPYVEAVGSVKLSDPIGTITATSLVFHLTSHTGTAQRVSVKVSSLSLTADSIDISPNLWTLRNVGGTGCKDKPQLYYIHTKELQVRPAQGIRVIRPELSLFGARIGSAPTQNFSFNGSGASLNLPYPTIREGRGLGVNWTNELNLDDSTGLYTRYAVFQKTLPYYSVLLMRSQVKDRDPEPPRSEIEDRFSFGYFDDIQVRDPLSERLYMTARRIDFGLASTFGADARSTTTADDKINKPIELIGEASGPLKGFGIFGIVRAQQVQVGNDSKLNRAILEQNVLSPDLRLARNLFAYGRVDAAQFVGGNSYSWLRGQAGVVFQPHANVRLGAAYTSVKDRGTPDYEYDRPLRFREIDLRADLDFDTTQVRFLMKYDPTNMTVYDREVYASRVVGCLEPYVVYRERPHKFFVGIKLPLTRVFDHLSKEVATRQAAIQQSKHVLSGPGQE